MKGMRLERVAEEIREAVSEILQNRISDRRLGMTAVTRVEVSRDLSHAHIWVSVLGDEDAQEQSLRVLAHARGFIRTELAHRLRAKRTPELQFRADLGLRYSIRLQQLLRELGLEGEAGGSAGSDTEDPAGSGGEE